MVGTSGVGKTSLVAKFVHSIFSDKYLTAVGVKIDKKTVTVDGNEVMLMIWRYFEHRDFRANLCLCRSHHKRAPLFISTWIVSMPRSKCATGHRCEANQLGSAARAIDAAF